LFSVAFQKFPLQSSCPQSQSSSIVSPVPSHEALQYLLPSVAGQLHGGFLHLFLSSAIESSSHEFELPVVGRTLAHTAAGLEAAQRAVKVYPFSGINHKDTKAQRNFFKFRV
jgi:hypothetical protein